MSKWKAEHILFFAYGSVQRIEAASCLLIARRGSLPSADSSQSTCSPSSKAPVVEGRTSWSPAIHT